MGVVGLHQIVEQPLAPLQQEADQQAVPLGGGKAPQGPPVIALAQLAELPANRLGNIGEIGHVGQQGRDLVQPLAGFAGEVSQRGRRRCPKAPQGGPAVLMRAIGQLADQPVEGLAYGRGQAGGDAGVQPIQGAAGDRRDQPIQCGRGGQDDGRGGQPGFGPPEQVCACQPVDRDRGQLGFEAALHRGGKRNKPKMVADAGADGAVGRLARRTAKPGRRFDAELAGEVDDGAARDRCRIVEKAAGAAQAAQMEGRPQPVVRAAGARDLPDVGRGQRPVVQDAVRIALVRAGGGRLSHRG